MRSKKKVAAKKKKKEQNSVINVFNISFPSTHTS